MAMLGERERPPKKEKVTVAELLLLLKQSRDQGWQVEKVSSCT